MKKLILITLAIFIAIPAYAATFDAAPGDISAAVSGDQVTVSWSGIGDIASVEQYRITARDGKGWIIRHKPVRNSVTFTVTEGDRFQLVDASGKWMFISPEWCVANYNSVRLKGVTCECSNPNGCALQVK